MLNAAALRQRSSDAAARSQLLPRCLDQPLGHRQGAGIPADGQIRSPQLEHESIRVTLENLATFPFVQEAIDNAWA